MRDYRQALIDKLERLVVTGAHSVPDFVMALRMVPR